MAKKIESLQSENRAELLASDSQTYSGTFIGELRGNATTASNLKSPMTFNFMGDATGSASSTGGSTSVILDVLTADTAKHAETADTALHVQTASSASSAQYAARADYATNAGSAVKATESERASRADMATTADTATTSVEANHAAKADLATKAIEATHATKADHATTADKLTDETIAVPNAKHAERADYASIAAYDCLGRAFHLNYALKSELPKEVLTLQSGRDVFVPRSEQILQAIVCGRAHGRGVVDGNTLNIQITDLATIDDNINAYGSIVFEDLPDGPHANTTKIYIDGDNYAHLWNNEASEWVTVSGELTPEVTDRLNQYTQHLNTVLEVVEKKLANAVTVDERQTIDGPKTFTKLIESPIADVNTDPARTVAVIHNVRDARDQVRSEMSQGYYKLKEGLDNLIDRIDKQQFGDFLFGNKDYTNEDNWPSMAENTTYINALDENKKYIELNPDTWQPVDGDKVVVFYRYITKARSGSVYWHDVRLTPDPKAWVPWTISKEGNKNIHLDCNAQLISLDSTGTPRNLLTLNKSGVIDAGAKAAKFNINTVDNVITVNHKDQVALVPMFENYMPKIGGDFTGSITVPDISITTQDGKVFNSKKTHELIQSKIVEYDNHINLHKYMPKAGGAFTGLVTVPSSIDLASAGNNDVLNHADIKTLIKSEATATGFLTIEFLDAPPVCSDMQENVLYSAPFDIFDPSSEITSLLVEPDEDSVNVTDNTGIVYGTRNIL